MDEVLQYEKYLRERITELRSQKDISEHRLSLELGRSGSYIRSITSGATMPSMKELFNIMAYFEVSPSEFFSGLEEKNILRTALGEKLRELPDSDLEKVSLFIECMRSQFNISINIVANIFLVTIEFYRTFIHMGNTIMNFVSFSCGWFYS